MLSFITNNDLFNNDLLFVAGGFIFIAGGVILTYSFYKFPIVNKSESLVNTNSTLDPLTDLPVAELSNLQYVEASVQASNINLEAGVQTANHYVNTGMQTSARMWLESIRNWITEILSSSPQVSDQYVDVGVQTNNISTYQIVKNWFLEVCSVRSSELTDLGQNNVNKWINKLDPIQSVDLHDSVFSLTTRSDISNSSLQELVAPNDSVSNISEVVSESNLQDLVELTNNIPTHYNIVDFPTYSSIINTPDARFSHIIVEGVHQYFVIVGNAILSVDPSVFNYFV